MGIASSLLNDCGFTDAHWVEGRESIADLFAVNNRCGIYLLHFGNEEYYIGQAVNVVRRYNGHRRNHTDIQQISFCPQDPGELNEAERTAIGRFERAGITLRNISLMSSPLMETDFDLVMAPPEQEAWVANPKSVSFGGSRLVDPEQRRRYQRRYEEFSRLPAASEVLQVLQVYAQRCIPVLRSSEMSFWCCSCLPGNNPGRVYSRINIFWQEVMSVYGGSKVRFTWQVALSPLEKVFGRRLWKLRLRFLSVRTESYRYPSGGADQVRLLVDGTQNALRLLNHDAFLRSARLFNLRLMRKGACTFSRYHCMDLADQLMPA